MRCLQEEGGRAADFTLEPGGLSVRENLLRLACGAVELWGLNDSLSSPPLKPRGLLLSVMRQKVGKDRSQGDCHPLGHPPDWVANHQQRKFGPSPTPLRLCKTPVGVPSGTDWAGDSTSHNSPAGRPVANHRRKHSSSGAVPLGTRTGQPLPQAEDGDAKHRDWLSPKLGRDFPMTADATPRRKAAISRYARATSAGVSRETAPPLLYLA